MKTRNDIFNCPVTLAADGDIEAWNAMQMGFLAHAAVTPDHLATTMASDSGFALPLVCKGLFCLFGKLIEFYFYTQQGFFHVFVSSPQTITQT